MFQRILVANRGEIALRVIRACRDLGVEVVVVYSEADRGAPYLELADQAICIGPPTATKSYLKESQIIAAADKANAEAIHPGYGFLSENASFAQKCRDCNIEFIGPPADAMHKLGNKNQAKQLAKQANVPTVPGSDGLVETDEQALKFARAVGYPVLIKAAAGGGGKGMRPAHDDASLLAGLVTARQEAEANFKDGSVYLEKLLEQPRHVEIQLLGDQHGTVVHLFERDCSLQRRNQKLVEESPAPNLPENIRREMCDAAVRLAKAAGYYSAGTCELLVDQPTRAEALAVMRRALREFVVDGIHTTIPLHQQIFNTAEFIDGRVDTTFIERAFLQPGGK